MRGILCNWPPWIGAKAWPLGNCTGSVGSMRAPFGAMRPLLRLAEPVNSPGSLVSDTDDDTAVDTEWTSRSWLVNNSAVATSFTRNLMSVLKLPVIYSIVASVRNPLSHIDIFTGLRSLTVSFTVNPSGSSIGAALRAVLRKLTFRDLSRSIDSWDAHERFTAPRPNPRSAPRARPIGSPRAFAKWSGTALNADRHSAPG